MTAFPLSKIQRLQGKAAKLVRPKKDCPEGWSISPVDPMAVLAIFKSLRMKSGYILRAYQYRSGDNGNGFVWAMHEKVEFPTPDPHPRLKDPFFESIKPPKPPDALNNLMEAIEGDGSPWSYLCASVLCRELYEFGAMWHGCDWSTHRILDENPLANQTPTKRSSIEIPSRNPADWNWLEPEPSEWQPHVNEDGNEITVTFFTFSELGRQTFYRNIDRFHRGSYSFESERKEIATGIRGFVF